MTFTKSQLAAIGDKSERYHVADLPYTLAGNGGELSDIKEQGSDLGAVRLANRFGDLDPSDGLVTDSSTIVTTRPCQKVVCIVAILRSVNFP